MKVPLRDDPYCYTDACIERLWNEYKTHGNLVIAFDFDNTIYDFHGVGTSYPSMLELLRRCKKLKLTLVCYTGNTDTQFIQDYCASYGVTFDYLNESPIVSTSVPHNPYFSILLDDRAGLRSAFDTVFAVLHKIEEDNCEYTDC